MKILWLASWYPNAKQPFDGDFIQRHARSVAQKMPVTVIYVYQYGQKDSPNKDNITINQQGNLNEIIVSFRYPHFGIDIINKLLYNIRYYGAYKNFLRRTFRDSEKSSGPSRDSGKRRKSSALHGRKRKNEGDPL